MRRKGIRVGLFQPITFWPFPIDALGPLLPNIERIVVVEASDGQLEDELQLALVPFDTRAIEFHHVRHMGGILPDEGEIVDKVHEITAVTV